MGALDSFITDTLGLTKLPPHLPLLTLSFLVFLFVHQVAAPWGSRRWFPTAFGSKGARIRNNWSVVLSSNCQLTRRLILFCRSIHVVSQLHAVIIVPLALWVLSREPPERGTDRAFGWGFDIGQVHAIACGYFLWDTLDAVINFTDLGFVMHGTFVRS